MKRKRYSVELIISILTEQEAGQPVGELARRYGAVGNTTHRWKSKYGGMKISDARRLPFFCLVGCGIVLKTTYLKGTVAAIDSTRPNGFPKASFAIRTKNSATKK